MYSTVNKLKPLSDKLEEPLIKFENHGTR